MACAALSAHCSGDDSLGTQDAGGDSTATAMDAGATGPDGAPVCIPGASVGCAGPNGCSGYQVCNAAGTGLDPCICGDTPDATVSGDSAAPAPDATATDAAGAADSGDGSIFASDAASSDGAADAGSQCSPSETLIGDFTVQNLNDVQTFTPYCALTGKLTINATNITANISTSSGESVGEPVGFG